ncbi:MAG: hypothetical protein E7267_02965 [Lachnospiraceae bacterium]|nr:hypothetical protein [Lachnospiraceae bacterium]
MKKCINSTLAGLLVCGMVAGLVCPMSGDVSEAAAKSIKVKKKVSISVGESYVLKAKVKPAKLKKKVKFTSKKKAVAKVTAKGKITGVKAGTAKIVAKVKGTKLKATCKVTVTKDNVTPIATAPVATQAPMVDGTSAPTEDPFANLTMPTKVDIEEDLITLEIGSTYEIKSSVLPEDAKPQAKFTSQRDWVASVDENGKVEALYPGMTFIYLTSIGDETVTDRIEVRVVDTRIPDDTFDDYRANIPHGQMITITYPTDYRDTPTAEARVYLPPGYSEDEEYNILFCSHGGGGNMWAWTSGGCAADKILDNLQADGLMDPVIAVFPNCAIPYDRNRNYPNIPSSAIVSDWGNEYFLLEFEILNNLFPYMKDNYSIAEGPEHAAVAGLSMGGGQALDVGLHNPDVFKYVACFSASPFLGDNQYFVRSYEDAEKLNSQIKLFTLMVGSEDGLANAAGNSNAKKFIEVCRKYELNHMFVENPGFNHEDASWCRDLYKFMQYAYK